MLRRRSLLAVVLLHAVCSAGIAAGALLTHCHRGERVHVVELSPLSPDFRGKRGRLDELLFVAVIPEYLLCV